MTKTFIQPPKLENRVILVDWDIFVYRSIFAWRQRKDVPATFTALSMLFSSLKKVGCLPDTLILIVVDSQKGGWRKAVDPAYKANRKQKRECFKDINWKTMMNDFRLLVPIIYKSTPFIPIEIEDYEADDIIAVACRYFKDKNCVIVSTDSDYDQLLSYPNVKIFSPVSYKYKHVNNPAATILKKVKREATDNLITPIKTEADYLRRLKIVNLLSLPGDVETDILRYLPSCVSLHMHAYDSNKLPYPSLRLRMDDIFIPDKVVEEYERKAPKKHKNQTLSL